MFYLCLAVGVLGLTLFGYVFLLERQLKDVSRRLNARLADDG